MAVYPAQLTAEEKNLKKRYAKLLEKRKQLRKMQEKPAPSLTLKPTTPKTASGETLSPKDAMAAAKKLLEAGKLKLSKKSPAKRTGFKRVGETPSDAPPTKKPTLNSASKGENTEQQFLKQKKVFDQIKYQKNLYSSFVRPSTTSDKQRIPKRLEDEVDSVVEKTSGSLKARTVFVECLNHPSVSEEVLVRAFSRFGTVEKTELRLSAKNAFITFSKDSSAVAAVREMNRGMIRGYEVFVKPAGEGNNFVELSAEAAAHPWAVIAAGKDVASSRSPIKKPSTHRTPMSYGEQEF